MCKSCCAAGAPRQGSSATEGRLARRRQRRTPPSSELTRRRRPATSEELKQRVLQVVKVQEDAREVNSQRNGYMQARMLFFAFLGACKNALLFLRRERAHTAWVERNHQSSLRVQVSVVQNVSGKSAVDRTYTFDKVRPAVAALGGTA